MKITSLLSTLACITASLCQSFPTSLAILYHPITKANVVLIGDRHSAIEDAEENMKEAAFEQFLPKLHQHIATCGYAFLFESNEYDEQQTRNLHTLYPTLETKGLQKLHLHYALHKNVLPHYKPCDPRTKNIKIFMHLNYFFDDILQDIYNDIRNYFYEYYDTTVDTIHKKQIKELLDEVIMYENDPMSCLRYFLHINTTTPLTYKFLVASMQKHLCAITNLEPHELATATPFNLFLDLELQNSALQTNVLKHQLITPYTSCAHNIQQIHNSFINLARAFKIEWNGIERLPLPEALITFIARNKNNNLASLCGQNNTTHKDRTANNFYKMLVQSNADTHMTLAVLDEKKSVIYVGKDHATEIQKILCAGSFICTFHQDNNNDPITDFKNFDTALNISAVTQ